MKSQLQKHNLSEFKMMSCFINCGAHKSDSDLLDDLINRGTKLRNAMVQSIAKYGPVEETFPETNSEKIRSFLQGDPMSRADELQALETLRCMSSEELCRITDRTYGGQCECVICSEYESRDLKCDLKRHQNVSFLQFVDCVKVCVNNVVLNEAGEKKVSQGQKDKMISSSQTFFLEYQLSEVLAKNRHKSKVDSGLDQNVVRFCARRLQSKVITFKQISIHDIILNQSNLKNASILFKLSFRNFRQKPMSLGVATFHFSSFEKSGAISNQELTLRLNQNPQIVIGSLKISVQLGCDHLYFGKEFIDNIQNDKENSITIESEDLSFPSDRSELIMKPIFQEISVPKLNLVPENSKPSVRTTKPTTRRSVKPVETQKALSKPNLVQEKPKAPSSRLSSLNKPAEAQVSVKVEQVLFGFIYISEGHFNRELLNSYICCQMFGSEDMCTSKTVAFGSKPQYNFSQQIPFVYDEQFLLKLRDNFMLVEFFEKGQKGEFLVGLSKHALHQFYLAYRNVVVVKYLIKEKLPVIGSDGWESIYNPQNDEIVGKVQVLVALGTKEQINNLKSERGFESVKRKQSPPKVSKVDAQVQIIMDETISNHNEKPEVEPEMRSTSDLLQTLQQALSLEPPKKDFFKAHIVVNAALHLPTKRKCKARKSKNRLKHDDILPSTYVTFEDYKNDTKITSVIPKSTSPKWDFGCDIYLPISYLTDNQKFLIFKVWRKATNTTLSPNLQVDHVIGFATVDLTVLAAGLPTVEGWFNINDLSKKCNGQINIHVSPLENVTKYESEACCSVSSPAPFLANEEPNELGRALKRKFTELDEITQRLRLRLSKVTNDESDASNDEVADEFERDINSLCIEEDFDLINFENEARSFNESREEVGLLQETHNNKKIDHMLQKLSLVSGETSSFRYVSGCSDSTEAVLKEVEMTSRPNLLEGELFKRQMLEKFGQVLNESDATDNSGND